MQRRIFSFVALVFLLSGVAAHAQTFGAVLTGSQERPNPVNTPAWGNATLVLDRTANTLTVTITVFNMGSPISGAHIHKKTTGQETGSVLVGFFPAQPFNNGTLTGTFPFPPGEGDLLAQNPSNYYVNVHTQANGGGAIRGELTEYTGNTATFAGVMRGSNEVPPNSSTALGGYFITIDIPNKQLTYDLNAGTIASPTAAHIHKGAAGASNPPFIGFVSSPSAWTGARTSGTISLASLSDSDLADLLANPQAYYVNIHSTAIPGGEVRAQLTPAAEQDVAVAGHVTNGFGTTFVTDMRIFNPSYDTTSGALVELFPAGTSPNTAGSTSITVNVPARATAVLNDVAGASGLNFNGVGGVRVASGTPLVVTSRIFADLRSSGKGTFGQFVPSVARANGLRRGVMTQLSNQSDVTSGSRTNIGFFNPQTQAVTVRLELRAADGSLLGQSVQVLQALSQQQNGIGTYFPGVDLSNAQNLTLSFDASAPIVVYSSIVDNVSTDQIFVGAQPDVGVAANNS